MENRVGIRLTLAEVKALVADFSKEFSPPLLSSPQIESYSAKLSERASFLLVKEEGETKGFVAYYMNEALQQLYVTLIAVKTDVQGKAYGYRMIETLKQIAVDAGFRSIALEVAKRNDRAHKFYLRQGFMAVEDREEKLLMELNVESDVFAPVLIPTLCRYEHFKRCVESLARCTHAQKTELVIGLDYPASEAHWEGYRKICDYVSTISGFKKVSCFKRETNYGPVKNVQALYAYAFEHYETLIASEDDNEFSPCFLDFMNKCFLAYANQSKVRTVCGYTQEEYCDEAKSLLFTYDNSAWGFGLWKHKEQESSAMYEIYCNWGLLHSWKKSFRILKSFPACLQMFMNMLQRGMNYGDTKRTILNILNETYQVKPAVSMVRNWGNDGTGLHCMVIDDRFVAQNILSAPTFDLDKEIPVRQSETVKKAQFYLGLPKCKFLAWAKLLKITLRYLWLRIGSAKRCRCMGASV